MVPRYPFAKDLPGVTGGSSGAVSAFWRGILKKTVLKRTFFVRFRTAQRGLVWQRRKIYHGDTEGTEVHGGEGHGAEGGG